MDDYQQGFDSGHKIATEFSLQLVDELEQGEWTFEQVKSILTKISKKSANSSRSMETDNG